MGGGTRNRIHLRRLGRSTAHRDALLRNMATALVEHGRIRTTLAKAKELRRHAERVVTWAKRGAPQHHALAAALLRSPAGVAKAFGELGARYAARAGGYARVLRAGFRRGDRAPMALIEFVGREGEMRGARPGRKEGEGGGGEGNLLDSILAVAGAYVGTRVLGSYGKFSLSFGAAPLAGTSLAERAVEVVRRQSAAVTLLKSASAINTPISESSSESSGSLAFKKVSHLQVASFQPAFPGPRPALLQWADCNFAYTKLLQKRGGPIPSMEGQDRRRSRTFATQLR